MRVTPSEAFEDPDLVQTLPATDLDMTDPVAPAVDNGWDSEAPTAVHARRPLFAGPPRLPSA
ncbi:MAG: hypothetical protein ABI488_18040 [Polyangiaceae bacterium]